MKQPETWFVIADGQRARIVRRMRTPRPRVEDVFPYQWINSELLSLQIDNEALGRASAAKDTATFHSIQPGPDPRRLLKQNFAEDLAEFLNRSAQAKDYDRLVLIAAPKTLGDIRGALSDTARNHVVAELDKDLTHEHDNDLAARFEELLP